MHLRESDILELEKFKEKNKDILDKYKDLQPVWGNNGYVLKYRPELSAFIRDLKGFKLSKEMAIENIKRTGFTADQEYILLMLGMKNSTKKVKKKNIEKISSQAKKQAEIFELLFDTSKECYIRIRSNATGEYRAYEISSLKDPYKLQAVLRSKYFSDNNDLMYSLNAYNNMHRLTDDALFSIQNLAIDIDFKINQYTIKEIRSILEEMWSNGTIPVPNIFEYGHRIRLIYSIEDVPATDKAKKTAMDVLKVINSKLPTAWCSSPQPLTSFARVQGSINSRNEAKVNIQVIKPHKYILRELQFKFLGKTQYLQKINKTNTTKRKIIYLRNTHYINIERLKDLEKIQRIRQVGYREQLCYVYRNYCLLSKMTKEEAWEATKRFNKGFSNPLKENTLNSDTKHLNRKQYIHKNQTLLDLFDIEPNDEEALNLKVIYSKAEYERRDKARQKNIYREKLRASGKVTKADSIEILKQNIVKLKKKKIKNKEIAKKLNISTKTLERYITEIKRESMLDTREQKKQNKIDIIKGLKEKGLTQGEAVNKTGYSIALVKRYWNT